VSRKLARTVRVICYLKGEVQFLSYKSGSFAGIMTTLINSGYTGDTYGDFLFSRGGGEVHTIGY
jgi:hypothetical protein